MEEVIENIFTREEAIGSLGLLSRALNDCTGGIREVEAKAASKILIEIQLALVDVEADTSPHKNTDRVAG